MPIELSAEAWREDLDTLAGALRTCHRDLHHTHSPAYFDGIVRSLRSRIPDLTGAEIVTEFARLVAAAGDGHTSLPLHDVEGFGRFPVEFSWFVEGLIVRRADPRFSHLLGARLLAIESRSVQEVCAELRPLVSCDNDQGMIAALPALLVIPEVLHARRIARQPDRASFTLALPDGRYESVVFQREDRAPARFADLSDAATAPLPLSRQGSTERNWFVVVEEQRVAYFAFNLVRDHEDEPFERLVDRLFDTIADAGVERLVIDLRRNWGGDNRLNRHLVHRLVRSDAINRPGRLFALIGRRTFSAAMNFAVDLERHTHAVFVGEATGSSPNHYGENHHVTLPRSGLSLNISALWWQYADPRDDRPWILPHLPVPEMASDYATNVDAALDAALRAG